MRQECGFGCVICGLAIVQYEHIDPPFAEALEHNPEKIALLCGSCHDRITRGIWSKNKVIEARDSPITFKHGFAKDAFDFKPPYHLFVGSNCFQNIRCIVRKNNGEEWFTIDPPEMPEAPPRLSAKFFAPNGFTALEICQNEWYCSTNVWDLNISGTSIEVRNGSKQVMLRLRACPPNGLEIQYLNMIFNDTGIVVETDGAVHLRTKGTNIQMNLSEVKGADAIFILP